jgi:hypothetical protein
MKQLIVVRFDVYTVKMWILNNNKLHTKAAFTLWRYGKFTVAKWFASAEQNYDATANHSVIVKTQYWET